MNLPGMKATKVNRLARQDSDWLDAGAKQVAPEIGYSIELGA